MTTALIVLAGLLGFIAAGSAFGKLKKLPQIVESLTSVGVKPEQMPILATLELLGALGLVVGIWSQPIGLAAAIGLSLYFLGAIGAHIKAKAPVAESIAPFVIALIALATAWLEFKR